MKRYVPISKIIRPSISGILIRKRLFRLLDESLKKPFLWIAGPPGSGKTTLIASYLNTLKLSHIWYQVDEGDADIATFFYYMGLAAKKAAPGRRKPLPFLTPEYLPGVFTFTKRYFENLYSRLKPPFYLVFDNYQKVSPDATFHEIVREGLSIVPEGINVILISRSEPPPALVPLRAANNLNFVGWNDIRLTQEESKQIIRLYGRKKVSDVLFKDLYNRTQGWAAGLMLFLERTRQMDVEPELMSRLAEVSYKGVFDYFAGEIFSKTDKETQELLLKTAFPLRITAQIAEQLTGLKQASQILTDLNKRNYFIMRHVYPEAVYQYHPLFREFLLSKGQETFGPKDLEQIKLDAARVVEENGQIENAVELYHKAGAWTDVARLIIEHAPAMIAQGRSLTVEEWIRLIPVSLVDKTPWLIYWLGACLVAIRPAESQLLFEKAFRLFQAQKNTPGIFLSLSGVFRSITFSFSDFKQFDRWISTLYDLLDEHGDLPSVEIEADVTLSMLSAILFRQPQHPDFETWAARGQLLLQKNIDMNVKIFILTALIFYRLYSGELKKASVLIGSFRDLTRAPTINPLALITLRFMEANYCWVIADFEGCTKAVTDGLKVSAATGVHGRDFFLFLQGAEGALSSGDMEAAREMLRRMDLCIDKGRVWERALYHAFSLWDALSRGSLSQVSFHAEVALQFALEAGMPQNEAVHHLGKALAMHELGEKSKAYEHIAVALAACAKFKPLLDEFMCNMVAAHLTFDQGDETSGLLLLRKAMRLGREGGYFNGFFWLPSIVANLCVRALDASIEVEYVRTLISKRNLVPDSPPLECENWPWVLKIHTLGRFELIKDGKLLTFQGKVQKKPLDMLKAIIAFGGKEVSDEQLIDTLWPEADGDVANFSFKTTLHRLRQLIGKEGAIELTEGRITLAPQYCWVDAWAFQRLAEKTESLWREYRDTHKMRTDKNAITQLMQVSEKAMSMYGGEFLPGDRKHFWTISMRERLKSKFIRLVGRIGNYYEHAEQWESVIELYQKALEVDDLQEEFYRRLMLAYQKIGRHAEMLSMYDRCRNILSSVLGIEPSLDTEAVRTNIKALK